MDQRLFLSVQTICYTKKLFTEAAMGYDGTKGAA